MYSFNFTFNTKLMDFMTKLESFIENKKTAAGAEALPCLSASYMYCHSSQNHYDVVILTGFFLFSFQVEVAKQKKQHENN